VSSTEVIQRAVAPTLQMEPPTVLMADSNSDPSVAEECQKAGLDMAMGEDVRNLDM
jgi:hypothetical protein